DTDARLARHDVFQDLVDVGLDQILYAPRANQWHDVTVDAASVGDDGCRLLRAAAFAEYETCFQVAEVEIAQLLDGDRLMVELALLGRIVTLRNPAQLDLRLFSRKLRRPDAMLPDRVATRTTSRSILNEIAALA